MFQAVGGFTQIEELLSSDIENVHFKEELLQTLRGEHLGRWRRLADLWTSFYFGNAMSPAEYRDLGKHLLGLPGAQMSDEQAAPYLGHPAVLDNDYFHWELEFPEVFFDRHGQPRGAAAGFDAVIGNPPYVRQEQLKVNKHYYQIAHSSFSSGADLYVYFVELGVDLSRDNGLFGYVTSNKFMRANYGEPIRDLLSRRVEVLSVIDFGEFAVFEGAATFPAIFHARKRSALESDIGVTYSVPVLKVKSLDFDDLQKTFQNNGYVTELSLQSGESWSLSAAELMKIVRKISQRATPLKDKYPATISFGVKTGLNKAFFVDKDFFNRLINTEPKSMHFLKKLILGDDVRKNLIHYQDRYVIVIPNGYTREHYSSGDESTAWERFETEHPLLSNHLLEHEEPARARSDQGEFWWELRPCDYYHLIESPKIVYPDIAMESRFALDENEGFYPTNTIYFIANNDKYLLAILNSRLTFFFMQQTGAVLGDADEGGRVRFFTQYVERIPIIDCDLASPENSTTSRPFSIQDYAEKSVILAWVTEQISKSVLNDVRDLLADLATTLSQLSEERNTNEDAFYTDLEGILGKKDQAATVRERGKQQATLYKNAPSARPFWTPTAVPP